MESSVSEQKPVVDEVKVKPADKKPVKKKKTAAAVNKKKETKTKAEREQQRYSKLEAELRSKYILELKSELESELRPKLEAELRVKLEEDLSTAGEAVTKLDAELRAKLESELKDKLEAELKPVFEEDLKTRLNEELRPTLESELKDKLEAELKPVFEEDLKARLNEELRPTLELELKEKLEAELKPVLEEDLKNRLNEELRPRFESELKDKLETELKPVIEEDLKIQLDAELRAEREKEIKLNIASEPKPGLVANLTSRFQTEQQTIKESTPEQKPETKATGPVAFDMDIKKIVEAVLFAADKPMTVKQIQQVYAEYERPDLKQIQAAIDSIIEDYAARPIGLKHLSSGYRFQVKDGYSQWVTRLFEEKPPKYSRALMETIAIIAYRQPVTRGDIEDIRGVSVSSNIIRTLLDREWVRVIAHKEVPGRPALYGTTKQFLDYFNLASLEQLPALEEIKDLDFLSNTSDNTDILQNGQQKQSQMKAGSEKLMQGTVKQEAESEEQTIEKQQIIEPISETRH